MREKHNFDAIKCMLDRINNRLYSIDENGLLYRNNKRIGTVDKDGYLRYGSKSKGRTTPCASHRVMFAYYHGIEELMRFETINHKDGNKLNNSRDNLEGCSFVDNVKHEWETGLNKGSVDLDIVKKIKKLFSMGYSCKSISNHLDLRFGYVHSVASDEFHKNIDFSDVAIESLPSTKKTMGSRKLTDEQIIEIREKISNGVSYDVLISKYPTDKPTLTRIKQGKYKPLCELA